MAAIKESFEALICKKDYNDIKVTELCARAKINKKTFYHYYPTLDDLLSEMQLPQLNRLRPQKPKHRRRTNQKQSLSISPAPVSNTTSA